MHVPLHINIEIHRYRSMFLEAPMEALTVKVGPGDTAARPDVLHDRGHLIAEHVPICSPGGSYGDSIETC